MSQRCQWRSSSGADIRHNEGDPTRLIGSMRRSRFLRAYPLAPYRSNCTADLAAALVCATVEMHPTKLPGGCRLVASGLPAPIWWLRGSCSLRSFPAGLFHQPRVPGHALARLTGGLHFSYRRLILRANGSCIGGPQKEWQLALSLRGLHV